MGKLSRTYTAEEIELVSDTKLTAEEIGICLKVHPQTIYRLRKKLNIKVPIGAKKDKPNLAKCRSETRVCLNTNCNKEFTVKPHQTKNYCSRSCFITVNNPGPKGRGSRPYRTKLHTPDFIKYKRLVHALSQETYNANIDTINPNRYPRTLCGVNGGWQLDHIKPIFECFINGVSPEEASNVNNLRMLPWKDNLMRNFKG